MSSNVVRNKTALKEAITGYILIAPAVILFLVIGLFSLVFSIWLCFFHLKQGSLITNVKFAGLDNFKDFLLGHDTILAENFRRALGHNALISLFSILFVIPISLLLSVLLQQIKWGIRIFRTAFLMPMVSASVAVYYVWTGIYDPSGTLNQLLTAIGLDQFVAINGWMGELETSLASIIVIVVWGGIPGTMLLYFAGLQTVDPHLYETAEIDGANFFQKIIHITWPILRPITVIAVILTLNGSIQIFDQIWVTTQGGPAGSTEVMNVLIYKEAFVTSNGDVGRANAMGWTLFIVTFVLSLISMRLFKDKTE